MPEQEQQMTAGPAAGAGGEGRRAHVPDGLILALACVAQFMVVLDVSIVNVALPSIGRELHYSATGLQWVVNAYVLTFAGFLLLGGRAADLFGRRRVFVAGLALFTLASLAGGAAGSILGGILTSALSWRWVLFVNIPIGVITTIAALAWLTETARSGPDAGPAAAPGAAPARRLDVAGAVTATP